MDHLKEKKQLHISSLIKAEKISLGSSCRICRKAANAAITNKIINALDTLVHLMVNISLPIGSVIITGAGLMVILKKV